MDGEVLALIRQLRDATLQALHAAFDSATALSEVDRVAAYRVHLDHAEAQVHLLRGLIQHLEPQ